MVDKFSDYRNVLKEKKKCEPFVPSSCIDEMLSKECLANG
jgi:hypothetical protein